MAAPPTAQTIADNLLTAVNNIISGELSSYSFAGRSFGYHNLGELTDLHDTWQRKADQASGKGIVSYADLRHADNEGSA